MKNLPGLLSVCLLVVLSAQAARAGCDFATADYIEELKHPTHPPVIEVEIPKSRKWMLNSLKILSSRHYNILPKYRKNFKATVSVRYPFGTCQWKAKVRQSGDWKDHIELKNGKVIASLHINLEEGNVLNAVSFKLLIPETRRGENEVFTTLLLSQLGYIAPKTFLTKASVQGTRATYLFQENAEKEMLERNLRREGPIFEGDEAVVWGKNSSSDLVNLPASLARQENDNWTEKGSTSLAISLGAFVRLQREFLDYWAYGLTRSAFLNPNHDLAGDQTFAEYTLLIYSLGGEHAIGTNNYRFYYNTFTSRFEPIYYDGNISFELGEFHKTGYPTDAWQVLLDEIPESAFTDLEQALANLDREKLAADLSISAQLDIARSKSFTEAALGKIAANFSRLKAYAEDRGEPLRRPVALDQVIAEFHDRAKLLEVKQDLRFARLTDDGKGAIVGCPAPYVCETQRIDAGKLVHLIADNELDGQRTLIVDGDAGIDPGEITQTQAPFGIITHAKGSEVLVDAAAKSVTFRQNAPDDWFLISHTTLGDWRLHLEGLAPRSGIGDGGQRFNRFGLTGCLNLYHVSFDGTSISTRAGQCEDGLNIVSGKGTIASIAINGAFADAFDADFSDISADRISVSDAGNDCVDVSTGSYAIGQLSARNCGDKGVSVGEGSTMTIASARIAGAGIGVSSKDLSQTAIADFRASGVAVCMEAFRKKQEFGGGRVTAENAVCDGRYDQDEESRIIVDGSAM
ncbi:MAG: hypothetical protein KDJ80_00380 [Nitratireductor sp.]|nr:hypothetical protein [Nitratireductor sp.]